MCGCSRRSSLRGYAPDTITRAAIAAVRSQATTPEPGIVRWLHIRWHGLPMPLRWRLAVQQARDGKARWRVTRTLPGCGCPVRTRAIADRVLGTYASERLHRVIRDLPRARTRGWCRWLAFVRATCTRRDWDGQTQRSVDT